MGGGNLEEVCAAVDGLPGLVIENPEGVGVLGVGEDVLVVPGPALEVSVVADEGPGVAVVIGAEEACFFGLDGGPESARFGGGYGDAYAAHDAFGETGASGDILPGKSAVGRTVDAASGAAAGQCPGIALDLPEGGEHYPGVVGVEGKVCSAGGVVLVKDMVPGLPTVGGAEDAALGVGAPGVAQGGDVDQVGVLGVDTDPGDVPGVLQADIRPRAAGVGGAVDAVAVGDIGCGCRTRPCRRTRRWDLTLRRQWRRRQRS